jgi:hypothetical protein
MTSRSSTVLRTRGVIVAVAALVTCTPERVALGQAIEDSRAEVASGCTIDLNHDGKRDWVIVSRDRQSFEVIAVLSHKSGYEAKRVYRGIHSFEVSCQVGDVVRSTAAGPGAKRPRIIRTGGSFVSLRQPEGSSIAYFWRQGLLYRVWTSD